MEIAMMPQPSPKVQPPLVNQGLMPLLQDAIQLAYSDIGQKKEGIKIIIVPHSEVIWK